MINDDIKLTGRLQIVLRDKDGKIKEERDIPNLVVTTGKNLLATRLIGTGLAVPSHMAVGTGATAPVAGNTTMQTELVRVALGSTSQAANVLTFAATFPAGSGTGALTEAGILNAASAGTLVCRTTFAPVNKDTLDSLAISWNLTIN